MGTLEPLVRALFAAQAGVATRTQLARIGVEPEGIRHRIRIGEWEIVRKGVVRLAGLPPSWESELVASALLLRGRAAASHGTAARLRSMRGGWSDEIEFTAFPHEYPEARGQVVHHTRRLELVDLETYARPAHVEPRLLAVPGVEVLAEVRVTTPARTIIDLAGRVSAHALGELVDDAAARRLASPDYLRRRLDDLRGQGVAGVRRLDEVFLDAGGHSWLERRFLRLVREAGFPRPRTQVVFRRDGTTVARVDFLFGGTRVIVEVSGRRGHASDADRAKDARRRNELQRQGYVVIEFLTTQVIDDPAYVLETLRRHLARTLAA